LTAIATRLGVTLEALVRVNALSDPNRIFAGERLRIPPRRTVAAVATDVGAPTVRAPADGAATWPARLLAHPDRLGLRVSFQRWASVAGVPAGLLEATAWMESGWQARVVSDTGAVGVLQLEPETVRFVSASLLGRAQALDAHNADANIEMGAVYLGWLVRQTDGSLALALASYYQGLRSVQSAGMYGETARYVRAIGGLWQQFRAG
jgi:soluble lytic murein transglycosylase-like protein